MEQHDCDESQTLFEIQAEQSQNCHHFCKTLSQQKHLVLQSTAPLLLKRFKVGSKMAIAASAPVLPNQIKQCCRIARFTDAPCINAPKHLQVIILSSDCQCPFSFLNHYCLHSRNCMFYTETLVNQTHPPPTPFCLYRFVLWHLSYFLPCYREMARDRGI